MDFFQVINILAAVGAIAGAILAKLALWALYGDGQKWRWSELRSMGQGAIGGLLQGQIMFHVLPPQSDPWQLFYAGLAAGAQWAYLASIGQKKAEAAVRKVRK